MRKKRWLVLGVLAVLLLAAGGCASPGARVEALLTTESAALSDGELDAYYRSLNDQIARSGEALDPSLLEAIRDRRNAVRLELAVRGLRP